jgi:putative transposase
MDRFRLVDGVYVYFVTFTIIDWLPVFNNPESTQILLDSMNFCIKEKGFQINAYVIMPNHMHIIVFDKNFDNQRLQHTLFDFRKFTGRKLAENIDHSLSGSIALAIQKTELADRDRQIWQPGWHAEGLVIEGFWEQKMNYIHENPVRKAMCNCLKTGGIPQQGIG